MRATHDVTHCAVSLEIPGGSYGVVQEMVVD